MDSGNYCYFDYFVVKEVDMAKAAAYKSKARTSVIRATSRVSVKVSVKGADNYYTLEYTEERQIPEVEGVDLAKERKMLWDTVNTEVDNQIEDIYKMYK